MKNVELKENVLNFMRKVSYAPLEAEELLTALKIKNEDLKNIWTVLSDLEKNGDIVKTRFNTYGLPEKMGLIVGAFQLTSKGFGFVLPDNKEIEDVFIPPNALNGAMNRDRVMARLSSRGSQGRRSEGEIIRIITRANTKIVGTFVPNGDYGFVVPDDKKVGRDIYIGAKNFNGAQKNQKVVAEITVWPEDRRNAEGKIVEILGTVGDVGLEIVSIIKQNDLPLAFPENVLRAAQRVPQEIKSSDLKGRRDLRELPIVTVDGEDAKDLDDAVYVEKQGEDYLLGVYIADVSNYVRENSVLDQEALERGISVYLVDRVLPMLPERLSNGICSLNEGEDRLTMCCEMLINPAGKVKSYTVFPGIICSKHRLTYTTVRKILTEQDEELRATYADIVPMLGQMQELCKILRAKRLRRGAIDFDIPEQKVILDEKKHPIAIVPRVRSIAESIIEEFMLAANETVAWHMTQQHWPFVYRVHDLPETTKMEELAKLMHNFGVNMVVKEEMQPGDLAQALAAMQGKPEEKMVSTVALRSLKQAVYQTDNIGHFGLAAEYYTHFTSPIRRYPDLIVHRLLRKWLLQPILKEQEEQTWADKLDEIAQHASVRERAAAEAERATVDLKKAEYMLDYVGQEFEGVISGVTAFGIFVELDNGVEGLVHISSLTDDYYEYLEGQYSLIGQHLRKVYRLGDTVKIEVLQVNLSERSIDFILAGESAGTKDYLRQQLAGRHESQGKKQDGSAYFSTAKKKDKKNSKKKKDRPRKRKRR